MSDNKSFETKRRSHVNKPSPKVHEESFDNREKMTTHRDWLWTADSDTAKKKSDKIQYNEYDSFDADWAKGIDQPKQKE